MKQNLMNENVEPATMKGQAGGGVIVLVILLVISLALLPQIYESISNSGATGAALVLLDLIPLVYVAGLLFFIGRGMGVI